MDTPHEIKAQALHEAADALDALGRGCAPEYATWLRERAASLSNEKYRCPRCGGYIPRNECPGAYIGALSRVDNETYICSPCGDDEGMRDLGHQPPLGLDEWWIASQR